MKDTHNQENVNPFTVNTKIGKVEVARLRLNQFKVIDRKTGIEVDSETIISKEFDKRPFTKVFSILEISKLNTSGMVLFVYIFNSLEYERDCIILSPLIINDLKISKSTYYKALDNLKLNNLIAKHKKIKNLYWINPNILFKGNYLNVKPLITDI